MAGALVKQTDEARLEFVLQGKLHLTRRPRVAGGETCVSYYPKRCAADLCNATGLSKVGVVKEIKELRAEFDQLVFTDFRALDD